MAQGLVRAKKTGKPTKSHAQKKAAGVTKKGQRTKANKKTKTEKERNSERLTKVINKNIEKEMIEKAEKERKGTLGVISTKDALNEIQYRKELKKKGVKKRK